MAKSEQELAAYIKSLNRLEDDDPDKYRLLTEAFKEQESLHHGTREGYLAKVDNGRSVKAQDPNDPRFGEDAEKKRQLGPILAKQEEDGPSLMDTAHADDTDTDKTDVEPDVDTSKAPSLEDFKRVMKGQHPEYDDRALTRFWAKTYMQEDPRSFPTLAKLSEAIKAKRPDASDADIEDYWDRTYGDLGARKAEPTGSDILRGAKHGFQQVPQLLHGVEAGIGAVGESVFGEGGVSTAIKQHGVKGYQEAGDAMADDSKASDSLTTSYEQAKQGNFGALADWLQYAIGYGGSQIAQMIATGGLGYVGGKVGLQEVAKLTADRLIKKETMRLTEGMAAYDTAKVTAQATANVAGQIGQMAGLGGAAAGMEGGEIFGDLASQTVKEGRSASGGELAKASAATLAAATLEFVGDKLGLDLLLGKSPIGKLAKGMPGVAGKAARAGIQGAADAGIEGGTEFLQTGIEQAGEGKDPFTSESLREQVDAAGLGIVGGGVTGAAAGARSVAEIPKNIGVGDPNVGVDEAIRRSYAELETGDEDAQARAEFTARRQAERANVPQETSPIHRTGTEIPILEGAPPAESPVIQGVSLPTPRGVPEQDPKAAIEAERQRLLGMKRTKTEEPEAAPPATPSGPLQTAADLAYPESERSSLPTQASIARKATTLPRSGSDIPILEGSEPASDPRLVNSTGPEEPLIAPGTAYTPRQGEAAIPDQVASARTRTASGEGQVIQPGGPSFRGMYPSGAPVPSEEAKAAAAEQIQGIEGKYKRTPNVAREQQRLADMKQAARNRTTTDWAKLVLSKPQATPVEKAPEAPPKAAEPEGSVSPQDIHALAKEKGLDPESDTFKEYTKLITGKSHIDDFTPQERMEVKKHLDTIRRREIKAKTEPKAANDNPVLATTAPRGTLAPEKNAEILARAEKAQADIESGGESGSVLDFLRSKGGIQDQGGELSAKDLDKNLKPFQKKVISEKGLTLDDAAELAHEEGLIPSRDIGQLLDAIDKEARGQGSNWLQEATTGPHAMTKARVEAAVKKIIADKGRDVGKDVERIKGLLLADHEFMGSPFAPKTEKDWQDLIAQATGKKPKKAAPVADVADVAVAKPAGQQEPDYEYTEEEAKQDAEDEKRDVTDSDIDWAINRSAHSMEGAEKRWAERRAKGLTDEDLRSALGYEFGQGGGSQSGHPSRWTTGSETNPVISVYWHSKKKTVVKGKDLLERARAILKISDTGVKAVDAERGKLGLKPKQKAVTERPSAYKQYMQEVRDAEANAPQPTFFSVEPAKDKPRGVNAAGEKLYERTDATDGNGTYYRMRHDRKDRPNGYPDFGGDLAPVENTEPAQTEAGTITTLSGRVIAAPEQKSTQSNQGVTKNVRSVDAWLVAEAIKEADAKNDDFNGDQFKRIDPKKITPAERDSLNQYLFGQENIPLSGFTPQGKGAAIEEAEGEPFSLTAPVTREAKAKEEDRQTSLDIPAETIGSRPIIGREATHAEAPLFSKAAQLPETEQADLLGQTEEAAPESRAEVAPKQPWEMTRDEYAKAAEPNVVPDAIEVLENLAYKANHSGYNPDMLTDAKIGPMKTQGFVAGTKYYTLTDKGRNQLRDWRDLKRENDLKSGAAFDEHYELVRKALEEGKLVPQAVLADYAESMPAELLKKADAKPEPKAPTAILADALRTAADQIEGKPAAATTVSLASHDALVKRLYEGEVTLDEYKQAFQQVKDNKDLLTAELKKLTKDQLVKQIGRNARPADGKDALIRQAYDGMLMDFAVGRGVSYSFGEGGGFGSAVEKLVARTTPEDLQKYAQDIAKRRAEYKERLDGFMNPKTLDDFDTRVRVKGEASLTPEQLAQYDELLANAGRAKRVQAQERSAVVQGVQAGTDVKLIETEHTRDKYPLFVVQLGSRVARETYDQLNIAAHKLGGRYSSYAKGGAVPGFTFKTKEAAESFMAAAKGETVSAAPVKEAQQAEKTDNAVTGLRDMADRLEGKADETLNADRKTNTAKRARQASSTESTAYAEKAIANTMRNLADAIESGDATHLGGLRTKAQVEMLDSMIESAKTEAIRKEFPGDNYQKREDAKHRPAVATDAAFAEFPDFDLWKDNLQSVINDLKTQPGTERLRLRFTKMVTKAGESQIKISREDAEAALAKYPKYGNTRKPWQWENALEKTKRLESMGITTLPELRAALREFVEYRSARGTVDKAKQLERNLIGSKGIGIDFFPTPKATAQRMVAEADIQPGMKVLEPSAGNGNIAEAIKAAGVNPDVVEVSSSLREILEAKGFNIVGHDFLDVTGEYDRIVMNPPFSNGQDAEHVMYGYGLLKPGGKLVAIVGEGAFFRSDAKATAFREWLNAVDGTEEKLPAGTFTDASLMATTGVNARLVTIEKPEGLSNAQVSRARQPWQQTQKKYLGRIDRVDDYAANWDEEGFLGSRPQYTVQGESFHRSPDINFGYLFGEPNNTHVKAHYEYAIGRGTGKDRGRYFLLAKTVADDGRGSDHGYSPVGEYAGTGNGIIASHRGKGTGRAFFKELMKRGIWKPEGMGYSPGGLAAVKSAHKSLIEDAIQAGESVPQDVLADYKMGGLSNQQAVYHGTPHVWAPEPGFPHGRPRLDKIGSGEGAQAYGWGWYSADSDKVAKQYAESLGTVTRAHNTFDGKRITPAYIERLKDDLDPDVQEFFRFLLPPKFAGQSTGAIAWIEKELRHQEKNLDHFQRRLEESKTNEERGVTATISTEEHQERVDGTKKRLDLLRRILERYDHVPEKKNASIYKLDIPDAVIPKLLAWDRPLREQSDAVKDGLQKAGLINTDEEIAAAKQKYLDAYAEFNKLKHAPGTKAYLAAHDVVNDTFVEWKHLKDMSQDRNGYELYQAMAQKNSRSGMSEGAAQEAASIDLRSVGIIGSRYLDGFSRGTGDPQQTYNYVIWDQPTLDKVALLARNGEKLDAIREMENAQRAHAPTFYSGLSKLIAQKMPAKSSGEQVKNILKDAKPEEVKWSGLDDYLKTKDYFTKQDVLDFLQSNNVQVEEVMKGELNNADLDALEGELRTIADWPYAEPRNPADQSRLDELNRQWERIRVEDKTRQTTKFQQYQLPGGSDYRELLLTLPRKPLRDLDEFALDAFKKPYAELSPSQRSAVQSQLFNPEEKTFTGGHWSEPNVLAHVRFNTRTVDGKKVLFLEEIQSDWHQKGRKQGYANTRWELQTVGGRLISTHATEEEAIQAEDAWHKDKPEGDYTRIRQETAGVPDAPFKKTWHELALKRMLRYAAENGYDSLAWTTGEQQAERYDLSKQVQAINYHKLSSGKYHLDVIGHDGEDVPGLVGPYTGEELADVVGKDIADKIVSGEGNGHLAGLQLKVGGEGMKGFYDTILPSFLNKYGKKWGATVGTLELSGEKGQPKQNLFIVNQTEETDHEADYAYGVYTEEDLSHGDPPLAEFATRAEAERYVAENNIQWTDIHPVVHALPVTEAMKESVLEGQSLFAKNQYGDPPTHEAVSIQQAIEGKSLVEAARFIATSAPSDADRLIAARVADQLEALEAAGMRFKLEVTHQNDRVPQSLLGTRGLTFRAFDSDTTTVYIQGADVTRYVGMSYETILHELIHAATQTALYVGNRKPAQGTPLAQASRDLFKVTDAIIAHFNEKVRSGAQLTEFEKAVHEGRNNTHASPDEILAWALTNREMQAYLDNIPYGDGKTMWQRFVEAVRTFLGLTAKSDSALSEVLRIADELLNTPVQSMLRMADALNLPRVVNQNEGMANNYKDQEGTDAFKKWFKNSKVVNKDGSPLVVYHGTDKIFSIFKPGTRGSNTGAPSAEAGYFFTSRKATAEYYSRGKYPNRESAREHHASPTVLPVYLSIQNPLVHDFKGKMYREESYRDLIDRAQAAGHDGVILQNTYDGGEYSRMDAWMQGRFKGENIYVAFEPNQIKSATGNRGTFDESGLINQQREQPDNLQSDKAFVADGSFDIKDVGNRRFLYNQKTGQLVLGRRDPVTKSGLSGSHAEDFHDSGADGNFDDYVRGWVGNSRSNAIIHFAPPVTKEIMRSYPAYADSAIGVIQRFIQAGANGKTILRNFNGIHEDKLANSDFVHLFEKGLSNNQQQETTYEDLNHPRTTPYTIPAPSRMDDVVRTLSDKNIDIRRLVDTIKATGREIADDLNPVLKEEMYMGRTAQATTDFLTDELQPLVTAMSLNKVTQDQLDEYLHARHAREANAYLKELNPDREDNEALSGMTDQEADTILAAADQNKMARLASRVDAILAKTRDLMISYGLESERTVSAWRDQYAFYVPLHRDGMDEGLGTGQGRSIRGSSVKRRTGSNREVTNILANVAKDREKTIVRGEKMRPVIALAALLQQNPNKDIATLVTPEEITYTDPDTGLEVTAPGDVLEYRMPMIKTVQNGKVVYRPDPNYKGRDNVINYRIAGKDHAIVFNERNPRAVGMATALKDLDVGQLNTVLQAVAPFTRYLASINTQYNPIFGIVNFVRDVQFAMLALSNTPLAGKRAEVLAATKRAISGIYADARAIRRGRHATSPVAQLWERFQKVGGPTGYRDLFRTADDRAEAIEHMLDPDWWQKTLGGKILTAGGVLSKPESAILEHAAKPLFHWLSDYNLAMENAVRLGVFEAGINAGMSDEQAASAAKNITVNFNKKGQISAQMGAMFAFFNASVQGTVRMAETLFEPGQFGVLSHVGRKIVAGGVTLGVLQAVALAMAGMGDDEPPEWQKTRKLILPFGDSYLSLPMPLGFNLLPTVGRLAAETLIYGRPGERASRLMSAMLDTLSPVGGSATVTQFMAPTVVDPIVALSENKDWTGKPIAREDHNTLKPTPGFSRSRDTATPWARGLAEFINYATLGTAYTPGKLSPTPDQIDYLIAQATGGIGREVSKASQVASAVMSGDEFPISKVPGVGQFAGSTNDKMAVRDQFYRNLKDLNAVGEEFEGRRLHREDVSGYVKEHPEAGLARQVGHLEREIHDLNKRRHDMAQRGASPERLRIMDEQITARMRRVNQRVEELAP